jgi:hypothetical protein
MGKTGVLPQTAAPSAKRAAINSRGANARIAERMWTFPRGPIGSYRQAVRAESRNLTAGSSKNRLFLKPRARKCGQDRPKTPSPPTPLPQGARGRSRRVDRSRRAPKRRVWPEGGVRKSSPLSLRGRGVGGEGACRCREMGASRLSLDVKCIANSDGWTGWDRRRRSRVFRAAGGRLDWAPRLRYGWSEKCLRPFPPDAKTAALTSGRNHPGDVLCLPVRFSVARR